MEKINKNLKFQKSKNPHRNTYIHQSYDSLPVSLSKMFLIRGSTGSCGVGFCARQETLTKLTRSYPGSIVLLFKTFSFKIEFSFFFNFKIQNFLLIFVAGNTISGHLEGLKSQSFMYVLTLKTQPRIGVAL